MLVDLPEVVVAVVVKEEEEEEETTVVVNEADEEAVEKAETLVTLMRESKTVMQANRIRATGDMVLLGICAHAMNGNTTNEPKPSNKCSEMNIASLSYHTTTVRSSEDSQMV